MQTIFIAGLMSITHIMIEFINHNSFSSLSIINVLMYFVIAFTVITLINKKQTIHEELIKVSTQKARQEEQELKERFELFFSKSPIPTIITSIEEGVIEIANHAFCEAVGYKEEYLFGKTIEELNLFDDFEERQSIVGEVKEKGFLINKELKFRKQNLQEIYFLISSQSIQLKNKSYMISVCNDITPLKKLSSALEYSEKKYKLLFETALEMIVVVQDSVIKLCNHHSSIITGYTEEELYLLSIIDLIHPDDVELVRGNYERRISGETFETCQVARLKTKNNSIRWIEMNSIKIDWDDSPAILTMISDITDKKEALEHLSSSEQQLSRLINQMQQGLAVHEIICDNDGNPVDYLFISVNQSYEKITGLKASDLIGKTVLDVLPNTEKVWIERYGRVALTGVSDQFEDYSVELNKYFSVSVYSPKENQFAVIVVDITESKKASQAIEYISYHDTLTGIYNRRFYEEEKQRLNNDETACPVGIIMLDVNGLKLVNDAFGHIAGDTLLKLLANAIRKGCRKSDIVSRIGGDEFIILLPNTDEAAAGKVMHNIETSIQNVKMQYVFVSASAGFNVKKDFTEDINDILKQAENRMYRRKLTESNEMRRKTIQLIVNCLNENISYEEAHSTNVANLCEKIAEHLNFNSQEISKIRTAGLLHDIGKVAMDPHLFIKTESLTAEDRKEIKRHSEVGYRILNSVNDYIDIAKFVLEHHERWDGTGYPKRLKGREISLQARILAIADAYDAMISNRQYRAPLSKEQAIDELIRNKGKQFDPEITELFLDKVLNEA